LITGKNQVEMTPKLFVRPVYLKEKRDLVREISFIEDAKGYLEMARA
jgi:hypothetical protein